MDESAVPLVTTSESGGATVITSVGDFDLGNLAPFRDAVQAATSAGRAIVLEMSGTTFVDSTVLGVITAGHMQCARNGRWLRIAAPRSNLRRVLQLMALDTIIGIYPTVEAALADCDDEAGAR